MKKVEVKIGFTQDFITYQPGKCYVMPEDIEADFRAAHPNNLGMSYNVEKNYKGEDLTGKKILCLRTGGIGDMLFLLPALQYLKKKFNCEIGVATKSPAPLLNSPAITDLYPVPFCSDIIDKYDYFTHFQGIIENSPEEAKILPAVDLFLKALFIDPDEVPGDEKVASINYTEEENNWLYKTLHKFDIKEFDYVIGIQMESSSSLRNYPNGALKKIIDTVAAEPGVKIVLIGTGPVHTTLGNFYKGNSANVLLATTFSVRQSIILSKRYDLVVSPDSFMVQVAGSLGKPLIGLYNVIPSDLRMRYFKRAIGLDCVTPCSPCYQHQGDSCIKGYPSPCWSTLQTDDILFYIDSMYYRYQHKHFTYTANLKLTERSAHVYY